MFAASVHVEKKINYKILLDIMLFSSTSWRKYNEMTGTMTWSTISIGNHTGRSAIND